MKAENATRRESQKSNERSEDEIRQRLGLREDSRWEFKQLEFRGNQLTSPSQEELAEDIVAFANASGGTLLCSITDDGQIQGLTDLQLVAFGRSLAGASSEVVKPALRVQMRRFVLGGKLVARVRVPQGKRVHECDNRALIRVGASNQCLGNTERTRLDQSRELANQLRFDEQVVPDSDFESLDERLWEPLISVTDGDNPRRALTNLRLLSTDEFGIERATVAGTLLCTASPEIWLPTARIYATSHRGEDTSTDQIDAQQIVGPLTTQIADAVKFVTKNMRVAARKTPSREDLPEYDETAVFEAMVNAVVHRDYSVDSRGIRITMLKGCLTIDVPGMLARGMTIESMDSTQATRNEAISSVLRRVPVDGVSGSSHRRFLMERRGVGVSIIKSRTLEATGSLPKYSLVGNSSVLLRIPAAKLELTPASRSVIIHSIGRPLEGVDVLVGFPNKTWLRTTTNETGQATFDLYGTHLPLRVYAAAPGFESGLIREWRPNDGDISIELRTLASGGSAIFTAGAGQLAGLRGRLNPIQDDFGRTYLYAENITIEDGRQQPMYCRLGEPLVLTDTQGSTLEVAIKDIVGRASIVEYRPK